MKKHKGIDPLQPGQWKTEPKLMRRPKPPGHVHIDGAYTNISNTCEQCISNQAHVLGFAVSYHDYQTHNSYYGKTEGIRKNTSTLASLKTASSSAAGPRSGTSGTILSASTRTTI